MKKVKIRIRLKIYPVLWSMITIASVYLLVRFAMLTFSEDMGQAGFFHAMVSKLCSSVLATGSSLVSYTLEDQTNEYGFPLSLVEKELALSEFVEDDTKLVSNTNDYSSLLQSYDTKTEETKNEEIENEEVKSGETDSLQTSTSLKDYLGVYEIKSDYVSLEYILTNGEVLRSDSLGILLGAKDQVFDQLQIGYVQGDIIKKEAQEENDKEDSAVETATNVSPVKYTLEQLKDLDFLVRNFYIVDPATKVTESLFDGEELISKDMTIKQTNEAPQILIYHTHSQEAYLDSRKNKKEDTVVGVGTYLAKILEEDYGYNVIHDTSEYDLINGVLDRDVAYNQAKDGISKILEDNPTIEVVIDLHRDSPDARKTIINGEETAQIMLFNGLSRDQNGPITHLDNPNLQDNLAFSLQLQLKSKELYPGLFYKNYLKEYRFNLHVRPKSILMELGTQYNTLESAMNAMPPFAEVLDAVLKGE